MGLGSHEVDMGTGKQWKGKMCLQTALLLGTCDPGIDFKEGTLRQSLPSCSLSKAFTR